jgi:acyl-CoA thioesterase I
MRLIAFGDSLMAGVGDPAHLGWIGRAVAGRREITLYNLGVRRETSGQIAARFQAEAAPRLSEAEPMRLVFSFGVNDCVLEHGAPRAPTSETLKNAQRLLSEGARLAPSLLVGPPPVADPGICARIEGLNEVLKVLAARLRTPFIDVFRPLAADGLWQAEAAAFDGAHPGAAGYQRLADLVAAHPAWRAFTAAD